MLYITCPTCGYFLGQKTLEYEEGKHKICSNPKINQEEKENELSKLLLGLGLKRYCSRYYTSITTSRIINHIFSNIFTHVKLMK